MNRLIAAIGFSASLAACATPVSVDTGKALAVAWASLDGAALTADAAAKTGKLHGQNAAMVATDLRTARDALTVATNAYSGTVAAGTDPFAEVLVATNAIAEITAILEAAK